MKEKNGEKKYVPIVTKSKKLKARTLLFVFYALGVFFSLPFIARAGFFSLEKESSIAQSLLSADVAKKIITIARATYNFTALVRQDLNNQGAYVKTYAIKINDALPNGKDIFQHASVLSSAPHIFASMVHSNIVSQGSSLGEKITDITRAPFALVSLLRNEIDAQGNAIEAQIALARSIDFPRLPRVGDRRQGERVAEHIIRIARSPYKLSFFVKGQIDKAGQHLPIIAKSPYEGVYSLTSLVKRSLDTIGEKTQVISRAPTEFANGIIYERENQTASLASIGDYFSSFWNYFFGQKNIARVPSPSQTIPKKTPPFSARKSESPRDVAQKEEKGINQNTIPFRYSSRPQTGEKKSAQNQPTIIREITREVVIQNKQPQPNDTGWITQKFTDVKDELNGNIRKALNSLLGFSNGTGQGSGGSIGLMQNPDRADHFTVQKTFTANDTSLFKGAITANGNVAIGGNLAVSGSQSFSNIQSITASSTSPILSLTQQGSGDALRVTGSNANKYFQMWHDGTDMRMQTNAGSGSNIYIHPDGGTVYLNTDLVVNGGNAQVKATGRANFAYDPVDSATPSLWLSSSSAYGDAKTYFVVNPASGVSFDRFLHFKKGSSDIAIIDSSGNLSLAGKLDIQANATSTFAGPINIGSGNIILGSNGNLSIAGNLSVGGSQTFTGDSTFSTITATTSVATPLIIGGTGTTSALALRSTSGVGTTGADIIFQTGNNGATEAMRILNNGNVGIGTTTPVAPLHVAGQCVVADTRLRRRRKKKGATGETEEDYDYDEVMIKDVIAGDEIASMDPLTGALVWRQILGLMDMGIKEIYSLTTLSGRNIRTTANHPYFVRTKYPTPVSAARQKLYRFEVDQSIKVETFAKDSVIALANEEQSFTLVMPAKLKQRVRDAMRGFNAPQRTKAAIFAAAIVEALGLLAARGGRVHELVIDIEYTGHEKLISGIILTYFPRLNILFDLVGKQSPAHHAAYGVHAKRKTVDTVATPLLLDITKNALRATSLASPLSSGLSSVGPQAFLNLSIEKSAELVKSGEWKKVSELKLGMSIAVVYGDRVVWEKVVAIALQNPERVYDIEIDGTHNFVGNDIIAHNTAIFGAGEGGTPTTTTIRGAAAAGLNTAGANLTFDASNGTGTGGSGALIFRTAPAGSTGAVANTLAERMRIDNAGNVGIGTTSPTALLHVTASSTNTLLVNNTSNANPGGALTDFQNAGTSRLYVANNGNVGIGQTTPTAVLHIKAGTATASTAPLKFTGGTLLATPEAGAMEYDGTSLFFSPSTTRLRAVLTDNSIPSNGMLAIGNGANYTNATLTGTANQVTVTNGAGTITLSTPQSIATASTPQFARLGLGAAADATDIETIIQTSTGANSKGTNVSHTGAITGTGYAGYFSKTGASTTNVGLYATASGATNNYAAIFDSGNVGIGTTGPTTALHISASSTTQTLLVNQTGTGNVADFQTNGTSRLYINSSGNVGIGTTTPGAKLQVAGDLIAGTNNVKITTDDGTNGYIQSGTGTLFLRSQTSSTNLGVETSNIRFLTDGYVYGVNTGGNEYMRMQWAVADGASAVAYNFDTMINLSNATAKLFSIKNAGSEKFTILASGNVGIGTASPTAVLHLKAGTATASTAPLKFTSGINLTTAEAGAVEYDGTSLFFSPSTTRLRTVLTDNSIPSNGMLAIGNGTNYTNATLTGTANQINIANGAGSITLSLPQNIHATSTPQFARLGLGQAAHATDILSLTSTDTTASSKALNIAHSGAITGTGYAGYFSKTGVSTTNVGLYATASGATNNYAAIFDSGNVGIGTTAPAMALHVTASSTTQTLLVNQTGTGNVADFQTNGTSRLYINSSGNVGIGTTSPANKLHLGGFAASSNEGIRIDPGTGGNALVGFGGTTIAAAANPVIYSDGSFLALNSKAASALYLNFDNANSASTVNMFNGKMVVQQGGSVGIGTMTPFAKFDVEGTNQNLASDIGNASIVTTDSQAVDLGGSLALGGVYTGTSRTIFGTVAGRKENGTDANYAGYLAFATRANGAGSLAEAMRITSTGNIGIGTTTPTAVLHLKAGTATASTAPLKFTSGINLTTAEAGTMEYDGTSLFFSPSTTRLRTVLTDNSIPSNGMLAIGNGTNYTNATLTGTANQITVTNGAGTITLSTPQSIATASTPQFARLGLGQAAHATDILSLTSTDTTASSKALNIAHSGAITGTGYAGYFSKTGVSTTNVGLYATASGATNNYAAIFDSGNVGIGTTAPAQKLEINQGHIQYDQVAAPSAPTAAVNLSAGNLNGNYYYRVSFITALGETESGANSALVAPANQQVNLSGIPVGGTGVTSRKIYRTTANGDTLLMQLVATISDNTTTTYTDNIADASLGVSEPRVNTTGGIVYNGTTRVFAADPAVTILGYNAGRVNTGYYNTFAGVSAGYSNTTGSYNTFAGVNAGQSNTTGYYNTFAGMQAGYYNTTGNQNTFAGMQAGFSNTTGNYNTFAGVNAGQSNTTGSYNTFAGVQAGFSNTTGSYNTFAGVSAGRFLADGATANQTSNNSLFLGYDTRAATAGDTNEIVVGTSAIGNGSNSVTLGNTSITKTILQGSVGIGTASPTSILALGGTAARTIQMERNTTAATAGQGLTVYSGGAIAGTADLAGGDLTLKSGTSTGTGTSALRFYTATAGVTGTADNAPTEKMTILGNGNVGIGTTGPGNTLHVNGGIRVATLSAASATTVCRDSNNDLSTCSSSRAFKDNIMYLSDAQAQDILNQISNTPLASFTFKTDHPSQTRFGIIAEEAPSALRYIDEHQNPNIDFYSAQLGYTWGGIKALAKNLSLLQDGTIYIGNSTSTPQTIINPGDFVIGYADSGNSTSTSQTFTGRWVTFSSVKDTIVAWVVDAFKALGLAIENGITKLQALTVGSPSKPQGITIYDEDTGAPYCIKMKAGQIVNVAGECGGAQAATPAPAPPAPPAPPPQPVLEPIVQPVEGNATSTTQ